MAKVNIKNLTGLFLKRSSRLQILLIKFTKLGYQRDSSVNATQDCRMNKDKHFTIKNCLCGIQEIIPARSDYKIIQHFGVVFVCATVALGGMLAGGKNNIGALAVAS